MSVLYISSIKILHLKIGKFLNQFNFEDGKMILNELGKEKELR